MRVGRRWESCVFFSCTYVILARLCLTWRFCPNDQSLAGLHRSKHLFAHPVTSRRQRGQLEDNPFNRRSGRGVFCQPYIPLSIEGISDPSRGRSNMAVQKHIWHLDCNSSYDVQRLPVKQAPLIGCCNCDNSFYSR